MFRYAEIDVNKISVSMFEAHCPPRALNVLLTVGPIPPVHLQGKLEMDNLQLKEEALDELDLPIKACG